MAATGVATCFATIMYPPQETNGEVRDLGSLVLPALAIKVEAGVAKIEELAKERTVPEVEMRRLLSAVAENVVR